MVSYLQIHYNHLPFLPAALCWLLNHIQVQLPVSKYTGINTSLGNGGQGGVAEAQPGKPCPSQAFAQQQHRSHQPAHPYSSLPRTGTSAGDLTVHLPHSLFNLRLTKNTGTVPQSQIAQD